MNVALGVLIVDIHLKLSWVVTKKFNERRLSFQSRGFGVWIGCASTRSNLTIVVRFSIVIDFSQQTFSYNIY